MGSNHKFFPSTGPRRVLTYINSELPQEYVDDIAKIDGSRVWIATDYHICEYHYELDKWLQIEKFPNDPVDNDKIYIGSIVVDKNLNLFIGINRGSNHLLYNGANFSFYPRSEVYQAWGSILHREGSIFIVGDPGVDVLKNGLVESFDDFPYE